MRRAKHIIKALYKWLLLESIDKGCEDRILGNKKCGARLDQSDLDLPVLTKACKLRMKGAGNAQHSYMAGTAYSFLFHESLALQLMSSVISCLKLDVHYAMSELKDWVNVPSSCSFIGACACCLDDSEPTN